MTAPSRSATALDRDYQRFLAAWPAYADSGIDAVRAAEFGRLDEQGQVYLDYTGGGLYPVSVVRRHADYLASQVLGNPHSVNPPSVLASEGVERCRAHVLRFFQRAA